MKESTIGGELLVIRTRARVSMLTVAVVEDGD